MGRTSTQRTPTGINADILAFLKEGNDFTADEAQSLFGVKNVSAHVSKLRAMGYSIYCNPKKFAGETLHVYRLGTPTRRVVAAGMKALAAKKRSNRKR